MKTITRAKEECGKVMDLLLFKYLEEGHTIIFHKIKDFDIYIIR